MHAKVGLMDLHTPGEKADWDLIKPAERSGWQKLAAGSGGVATPSNVISIAGFLLVIIGLLEIARMDYISGIVFISLGRAFDLLDGYIAHTTKTKGRLGETIDTTVDKIEIFTALIVVALADILPDGVIFAMIVISIWISLASLVARHRGIDVHPSLAGKLSTASVWASIVLFLFSHAQDQPQGLISLSAYGFFGIFIGLGCLSAIRYSQSAMNFDFAASKLLSQFDNFVVISNPKSSNASRTLKRIKLLKQALPIKADILTTPKDTSQLQGQIQKYLDKKSGKTLIFIGGGDGTVHDVINALMNSPAKNKAVVLPIWGGNANDFAYMLNGPSYKRSLVKVLKNGRIVSITPLKISIRHKNKTSIRYAACYTSFGATAFAAHQLDKRLPVKKNWLFSTPAALTLQEIWSVTDAFKKAPVFRAKIDGQKVTIFEEAFMNGPRIAKINTVPLKLTDNAYYHAHQPNKHPLLSRRVIQALTGRKFGRVKSQPTRLAFSEPAIGQFDGEVSHLEKSSEVTVSLAPRSIQAISIKL